MKLSSYFYSNNCLSTGWALSKWLPLLTSQVHIHTPGLTYPRSNPNLLLAGLQFSFRLEVLLVQQHRLVNHFHLLSTCSRGSGTCKDWGDRCLPVLWKDLYFEEGDALPRSSTYEPTRQALYSPAEGGKFLNRRHETCSLELSQPVCSSWCLVYQIQCRRLHFERLCPNADSSFSDQIF